MKVTKADISEEGESLIIEIDGRRFDSDDYPSTKNTIQSLVNYVEIASKTHPLLSRGTI